MKRAAVYLRVSSDDGRQTEENQEPDCLQLCARRGWEPVIYREQVSAVNRKGREQWRLLLEAARTGAIDAVVFFSISRIGRKRVEICADLADLVRWRVAVVSVRESFLDLDGSPELAKVRELLIQWWAWYAEQERDDLIDKTHKGLARVRANFTRHGAHVSKSGRMITKLGRPDKFGVDWKRRALALAAQAPELTYGEIARRLQTQGCEAHKRTILGWIKEGKT